MVEVTEKELYCYINRKSIKSYIIYQQNLLDELSSTLKYKAKVKIYRKQLSKLYKMDSSSLLTNMNIHNSKIQLKLLESIIQDNDNLRNSLYAQLSVYYEQLNKTKSFMKKVKVLKNK
jgi:hypothetical protein